MADVFKTKSWALKVPDNWDVTVYEEMVEFTPHGVDDAALIVSGLYKADDFTMDDMHDFIQSDVHDSDSFTAVHLGDFAGYSTFYTRRHENVEAAWRVWCVFCRDLHLYITYNCTLRRRGHDDAAVDDMLKTIMCFR